VTCLDGVDEDVRDVIRGFPTAHLSKWSPTDVEGGDQFRVPNVVDDGNDDDGISPVPDRLVVQTPQVTNPKSILSARADNNGGEMSFIWRREHTCMAAAAWSNLSLK